MQNTVATLERIKQQMKRNARLRFAAQERQRQSIEGQLAATVDAIDLSRQQPQEEEVMWLAEQHSHRLRLELQRRKETELLSRQSRVVEEHRDALRRASQEARLMELLVEHQAEEAAELRKRTENNELDALAMARWHARCA
jgi:flagellar biosynthesis chaperone FliJ